MAVIENSGALPPAGQSAPLQRRSILAAGVEHGLMKLVHFPIAQAGAPDPLPLLMTVAAVIEIIGGALLTLGLFTRVVAFVCAGQMAIAYFMAHAPAIFWPGINGGGEAILYCFIFLYRVRAGAGAWSVDALRESRG